MPKAHKRVMLVLGWYDYRLHRGIEKYALEHGWRLFGNLARERAIPWGWNGDGILAWLGADKQFTKFVTDAKMPTVDFSFRRPKLNFARVLEDHAHAAALVAEHFLVRGFRNFLFYSDTANWSYEERGTGFTSAITKAGYACDWLKWHKSKEYITDRFVWQRQIGWLSQALRNSPKPVGVFAANDELSLDVLEAAERADLMVPEQVAIVGAENYLLANNTMPTPISSVDTNLESLGYQGAQLLDNLMQGKKSTTTRVRVPAAGVVTRKSSDLIAVNHRGVARVLRLLREHTHEPIRVADMARVAAMSRRGFHQAFVDHIGRTPAQEMNRIRIDTAKRLLHESEDKVETVGAMCGYKSANSFSLAFKRTTGISPKHYRDSGVL